MFEKFIIRFDDITPQMSWEKFNSIESVLDKYNIRPIVGVVPNCRDESLNVSSPNKNFWQAVRSWQDKGWSIAQHGYTHEYHTRDSGLLGINKNSEFSGFPYEKQLKMLSLGKKILMAEGVWQPIFMAPSHSFDVNTLKALASLEFKFITDGYGLYPYPVEDLIAIPQLFSRPFHVGFGIYTICLHVNSMNSEDIKKTIEFICTHKNKIITFNDACTYTPPPWSSIFRYITSIPLKGIRKYRAIS
jgi:predicted deacetylase